MTEQRLNEILDEQKIVRYRGHFLKAMKQAVNEALDEAAENVDFTDETYSSMQEGSTVDVDKHSILNLKVE